MTEPVWDSAVLTRVATIVGNELTGTEIGMVLGQLQMRDPAGPAVTKWKRLLAAFEARQAQDRSSKRIITFITRAMAPARYSSRPEVFTRVQGELNETLVFVGLRVTEAGQVARGAVATTLDEASAHAASLVAELRRRNTHAQVLAYCGVEVLKKSYFHASLEAAKGVFDRLRTMSQRTGDGAKLIDEVVSIGARAKPVIAVNSGRTASERDEQVGFATLLKGLNSMYRNPTAHDPRATRTVSDDELLELLTMISMIHRRLDLAVVTL
ncbi:TIGR02391 family protein [Nocardia sp. NPDC055321]